jgi:8-oxo-dGTP diphosphatase
MSYYNKEYVVGLVFTTDLKQVVLIKKNRPDWQKGKLNGIGGKLEKDETALTAMIREFEEETGVLTEANWWKYFLTLYFESVVVHFFTMSNDDVWSNARTTTDELVGHFAVYDVINSDCIITNIKHLIPLAIQRLSF